MFVSKARIIHGMAVGMLLFSGAILACRQESKTKATTPPVDTTVVDDDTLEVNNTPNPAARAR
jgi:hypothetical protein